MMTIENGLSIVITYYRGENFIYTCIDSILNSYNESAHFLPYEIIVVIDSMEDAEQIESSLRTRYASNMIQVLKNQTNLGVSKSRNNGLKLVKYKFFTIIDQDDYVAVPYFAILEKKLDHLSAIHILNGTVSYKEKNKHIPIYYFAPNISFESLVLQTTTIYTPGLVIFNRDFISSADIFIETSKEYKGCDDWAAYLNILATSKGEVKYTFIDSLVFIYCLHDSNYSHNKKEMELGSLAVINYFLNALNIRSQYRPKLLKALKRNEFLFALRINQNSVFSLFKNYPIQILNHYFFSFFKKDRLNRLIFRLRHIA